MWWRLFRAPDSASWSNALILAELLFSLSGKVERVFSLVTTIKVQKRSQLGNDSLDDLVILNSDKTVLNKFSQDSSIDLFWSAKTRRPSRVARQDILFILEQQFLEAWMQAKCWVCFKKTILWVYDLTVLNAWLRWKSWRARSIWWKSFS